MNCTLMHKRLPVAAVEIDGDTGIISKINIIYAAQHLPVGVTDITGYVNRTLLNEWWKERAIPLSRFGIREALEKLDIINPRLLLARSYGLSLSDQYWVLPDGADLVWDRINFFNNSFSEDIGDILFNENKSLKNLSFNSPDSTSDGDLKKRWKIIDGKRCLIKGGSAPFRQQPFNEVIASDIAERLNIPHVPYTVTWYKGEPYSVCADFVTENTELVPAWRIVQTQSKKGNISYYRHFINCCESLGIPDVIPFIDQMLALDFIIANEDRHLNNFGALRNAETLEWLGMAPIYDSGNSLGYNRITARISNERATACKPFRSRHKEQIKLISALDWLDFNTLSDVGEMIQHVFAERRTQTYICENRAEAIADATERRIKSFAMLQERKALSQNSVPR